MYNSPRMPASKRWLDELERYEKASKKWREDANKIVDSYTASNNPAPRTQVSHIPLNALLSTYLWS